MSERERDNCSHCSLCCLCECVPLLLHTLCVFPRCVFGNQIDILCEQAFSTAGAYCVLRCCVLAVLSVCVLLGKSTTTTIHRSASSLTLSLSSLTTLGPPFYQPCVSMLRQQQQQSSPLPRSALGNRINDRQRTSEDCWRTVGVCVALHGRCIAPSCHYYPLFCTVRGSTSVPLALSPGYVFTLFLPSFLDGGDNDDDHHLLK